ncbi:Mur ligase family protein [Ligilactobacillus ceti]|uniref:Lipid II isoglutaminyl synthase (glutamine-hydrolyzing) subunit MurT n=1 Tax=Ligilactobacillus ceti DSM 22408 TaxID=1122146 RepID=A0A0R2KI82_9LACO|nr:Mur ligase family protein [Ligilactobacillus ceti]KRN89016.1 UDP-N-acetylmuramoylalanyl-D-glutamate--2,6-diaminopimelate ligase [Ligilactobacillus ceti DSM 22408]
MSLKSSLAITAGRFSQWFLKTFTNGGTSFPGKLTLKLDPEVLKTLAKNYEVIIITGTNGKTLTTALTVKVLKNKYSQVLTNPSGSNMEQGIVSAFLSNKKAKNGKNIAVLETDEANVPIITNYITPTAFVLTNIFRDQMDRFGEIYTTNNLILEGIKKAPQATIIANGDTPLFNNLNLPNPVLYYGFDYQEEKETTIPANTDGLLCPNCQHVLHYLKHSYANLGQYYCPSCDFKRPKLTYKVTSIHKQTPTSSQFAINGQPINLHIGGTYNIYNALAAYAVGRFLNIQPQKIAQALSENDEKVFGRQEVINVDGKEVTLILVKNPVGLDQVLEMISTTPNTFSLAMLLNANYADGIDTSWIWDAQFEKLPLDKITNVITGGERVKDITFRLKVAGVPSQKLQTASDLKNVIEQIKTAPTKDVYILATYTAVLQLRKELISQGYIKEG